MAPSTRRTKRKTLTPSDRLRHTKVWGESSSSMHVEEQPAVDSRLPSSADLEDNLKLSIVVYKAPPEMEPLAEEEEGEVGEVVGEEGKEEGEEEEDIGGDVGEEGKEKGEEEEDRGGDVGEVGNDEREEEEKKKEEEEEKEVEDEGGNLNVTVLAEMDSRRAHCRE